MVGGAAAAATMLPASMDGEAGRGSARAGSASRQGTYIWRRHRFGVTGAAATACGCGGDLRACRRRFGRHCGALERDLLRGGRGGDVGVQRVRRSGWGGLEQRRSAAAAPATSIARERETGEGQLCDSFSRKSLRVAEFASSSFST